MYSILYIFLYGLYINDILTYGTVHNIKKRSIVIEVRWFLDIFEIRLSLTIMFYHRKCPMNYI